MEKAGVSAYMVLGSGMGSAIAHFLSSFPGVSTVYITDQDRETARNAAYRLNSLMRGHRLYSGFDFDDRKDDFGAILQMFPDVRVVISALPARCSPKLAEASIAKGRHFLDLGGVSSVTQELKKMHKVARQNKVSVISDNGLMPGIGLMLARGLVYDFPGKVNGLYITVGGIPQKPEPPLYYMPLFSKEGLWHLCFDEPLILLHGKVKKVPPFYFASRIQVSELKQFYNDGWVEAFVTAGAADTPEAFKKLGVKNFWERTIRWPGFMDFVKNTCSEKFEEELKRVLMPPVSAENPDAVWMRVEADGLEKDARVPLASYTLFDGFDGETGMSAMQRTTGFSAALMAHFASMGKTKPGVLTPDSALGLEDLREFISLLKDKFSLQYQITPVAA